MEDKLYSKTEAAEYLRISLTTLDRLIAAKKITFSKIGGEKSNRVIFEPSDLKIFLASGKVPVIRDSTKQIKALIPPGAVQLHDPSGRTRLNPESHDAYRMAADNLENWEREIACREWHEPAALEKLKILFHNLETIRDLCYYRISGVTASLIERLTNREARLFETEIRPTLKLPAKYMDLGRGKAIELKTRPPLVSHNVRVAGESYVITDTWAPIPVLSEADGAELFHRRYVLDIRIAARSSQPVSFREQQAQQAAAEAERLAACAELESDLI